jgi:hypothetical protein
MAWRANGWAAAGLGLSWIYWASGSDVEVYAPATLALLLTLTLRAPLARALAGGLAIALHLEHVLLLPFLLCEAGPTVALSAALLGAFAYAIPTLVVLRMEPLAALQWILSSSHGFPDALGASIAGVVFGGARTFAAAPFPYEAPARTFVPQMIVGAFALVGTAWISRNQPAPFGLRRRSIVAFLLPYAAFGLFFFPSESERWLFLLPLFWAWSAGALARAPRPAALGLVALGLYNGLFGVLPRRARSGLAQARAARAALAPGDLILAPGHGWDEYVDLAARLPPRSELVLLSYYAGRDGPAATLRRVHALASHRRRVVLLRFLEDRDPQGWMELDALGLPRDRIRAAIGATVLQRLAPGVYARLEGEPSARPIPPPP